MGKLSVTTFVTLDGVMQAPGGPGEDDSDGFAHGGWLVPFFDEDMGVFVDDVFSRAAAFLLGRKTWQILAGHWPRVTDPNDRLASLLNTLPKYVVSTTLREVPWSGSTLIRGDLVDEIRRLKGVHDGELQVHGSCGLIQTLLRNDLADELHVLTFPVVLGEGKRLFGSGTVPTALKLSRSRTTSAGTVISSYTPTGRPTYGSFGLDT